MSSTIGFCQLFHINLSCIWYGSVPKFLSSSILLGSRSSARSLRSRSLWAQNLWEIGICVDPPLCRATSHGTCGSYTKGLVCVGETDGKIGKVGGRELVLVVSVRCGKEWDMTRGWQLFWDAILSVPALEPRVFALWNVVNLFSLCCDTLCASVHAVWVGVLFTCPSSWSLAPLSHTLLQKMCPSQPKSKRSA